jgi:translation initiation factor 1
MSEICTKCGLPKELCVCESIAKENQKIIVKIERRKFGKKYTIISGIDQSEIDLKDVAKKLKSMMACGGSYKDGKVELQGDHRTRIKDALKKIGFGEATIKIA